ncbi:DNA mismatch repair protein MSH2 [Gigaspora margarita]|uniref:DNA mismatch repair protein MSH2 n=1 Tax=Gigaspora margarita TaxID=4874 RepID=A0A8H4EUI4_GIGMA|nr:DNA mismatch repair protein MSH2 [Gigaspora margarita]
MLYVYISNSKLPGLICAFELFNSMDDTLRDLIEEIFLTKLMEHNDQLEKFKELVKTTVDFEAAKHHHYVLKADFNDELKVIKEKLGKPMREMNKKHQMVGRKLGLDTKKKFILKNKHLMDIEANCLCGQSEYIELATQRTGVFFTTQKLKELSSDFLSESDHYDDVQSSLVKEVINISGEGHVILKNARQPCLKIQDDVSFISNDVELIRSIYDESFGIHVVELANFPEIAVKLARRKANELKVFMNHQDAKDKCSKQEIEEGDIIIKEFLRDIAQTPDPESMNYNSILDRIQEVKGKYQEKIEGNPWFRDVIAGF